MLEIFSDLQKKIEAYEPVTPESDASGRSDGSFFGGVFLSLETFNPKLYCLTMMTLTVIGLFPVLFGGGNDEGKVAQKVDAPKGTYVWGGW